MKALEHLETLYLGCRQLVMKADDHEKVIRAYMDVKSALEDLQKLAAAQQEIPTEKPGS